jgi:hypothetical protein
MGKMKEQQMEMFFEDVAPELIIEEDIMNAFDIHPDWNDLDVTYTVEYNDTMTPITLEEFDTMVAPIAAAWTGVSEAEQRDYIMWEETKPLTTQSESDMLRKEIQELTETLYKQYKRVAELTDEVNSLKQKLEQVTNIHSNTRKF